MRMRKKQFRIGYLAKELGVDDFVIRFWEREFKLSTNRSRGGQRFYSSDDLQKFKKIKELLHTRGFTIAGAKRELLQKITSSTIATEQKIKTPLTQPKASTQETSQELVKKCTALKQILIALKEVL